MLSNITKYCNSTNIVYSKDVQTTIFIVTQKLLYTIFRQNKFRTDDNTYTSCLDTAIDFANHSVNQKYADYDYSYVQNNVTKEIVFEVGTK